MIDSSALPFLRCPDCRGHLVGDAGAIRCAGCARRFDSSAGYLDLRPTRAYEEQTKYLDAALHADARHETIAPPLLGSKIRHDMLRRFLALGPGDRAIDLGCGSGRQLAWNADAGATMVGVDISPFFAREALESHALVLGDLRQLPVGDGAFTKAWTLDVLEHVSPQALREVLTEANRVLTDGGALFAYSHVRKNGWPAKGVRFVNALARGLERVGLLDLRQERLRKSDHLNPIADHHELDRIAADCGFTIERRVYYTPIIGAFVENVLARLAEHWLVRRRAQRSTASTGDAIKAARTSAKARVRRGGVVYYALRGLSAVMRLDIVLFGRIRSGPFFVLMRKVGRPASTTTPRRVPAQVVLGPHPPIYAPSRIRPDPPTRD